MSIEHFHMRVFPRTIEHLGIKMYATFPIALAELIANAYDAEATRVDIEISTADPKKIVVRDNGIGMSPEEVNDKFLMIGRNRREEDPTRKNSLGRTIMGRKGLGKLALFGLGNCVEVSTSKAGNTQGVKLTMEWDTLRTQEEYTMPAVYFPKESAFHGTTVTLTSLKKRLSFSAADLAEELAKLFYGLSDNFRVYITVDGAVATEVTSALRFQNLEREFEWNVPEDLINDITSDYPNKDKIKGFLFTTPKPNNCRGITLYANGRLVSAPSFFNLKASSYIYAYLTGVLNVDFIDEDSTDEIITTNRQAIDWSSPVADGLEEYLQTLIKTVESKWREERPARRIQKLKEYENKLKENAKLFRDRTAKGVTEAIAEQLQGNTVPDKQKIERAVRNQINEQNPLLGLKKEIHSLKKKIMISHCGEDKVLADMLYDLLVFNGIKPEEILYTSSLDPDSRIPMGNCILDYLRKFFVDSISDEKMLVLYVTSEKMAAKWSVMLEVGAGWITQSNHHVFRIKDFKPQPPLDTETEWHECSCDREKNILEMSDHDRSVLIEKLKFICRTLNIIPRTDTEIDAKIKQLLGKKKNG